MILLEQVSTIDLLTWAESGCISDITRRISEYEMLQMKCQVLLTKYCIYNYQMLKDYVDSGNVEFDIDFFKTALLRTQLALERANKKEKIANVYFCNDYKHSDIDSYSLRITDKSTMGDVLPVCNLLNTATKARVSLSKYSIETIKRLLGQVVICNETAALKSVPNAFGKYGSIFGEKNLKNFVSIINFYEEQVIRQAHETNLRGVDLFSLNREIKLSLVQEQLNEILGYILECGDSQFFGPASLKRNRILKAIINNENVYNALLVRENVIQFLTNYTTLDELEQNLVRSRSIDRFF